MFKSLVLVLVTLTAAQAFTVSQPQTSVMSTSSNSALQMAPKYKDGEWTTTSPEEGPEAGYSATRTLLLHGPLPFFNRVATPDQYEQAVLKFMAGDKCSRDDAQGNMDAYLRNPNDWAVNRIQEERTGKKINYTKINTKGIVLTVVWSTFVVGFVSRAAFAFSTGIDFYAFGPFTGSY